MSYNFKNLFAVLQISQVLTHGTAIEIFVVKALISILSLIENLCRHRSQWKLELLSTLVLFLDAEWRIEKFDVNSVNGSAHSISASWNTSSVVFRPVGLQQLVQILDLGRIWLALLTLLLCWNNCAWYVDRCWNIGQRTFQSHLVEEYMLILIVMIFSLRRILCTSELMFRHRLWNRGRRFCFANLSN